MLERQIMIDLRDEAIDVLRALIRDPKAGAHARVRAAETLLRYAVEMENRDLHREMAGLSAAPARRFDS